MAEATLTVNPRISAGGTKYWYTGTIKHDSSYASGGQTLKQPSEGPKLPEQIDFMQVTGGPVVHRYKPKEGATAAKLLGYTTSAAAKAVLIEVETTANLSGITYSFLCLGD